MQSGLQYTIVDLVLSIGFGCMVDVILVKNSLDICKWNILLFCLNSSLSVYLDMQ